MIDETDICVQSLSHVQLFVTPTVTCQPPLSMEFSRQEHWSGLPFPPAGDQTFVSSIGRKILYH